MLATPILLIIKWIILLGGGCAYIFWLSRQDRILARACAQTPPVSPRSLMQHLQSRSLQASIWAILCLVLFAVLDIEHHNAARRERAERMQDQSNNVAFPPVPDVPPSPALSTLDTALTGVDRREAMEERLDALKESFESGFVSYFYLRRCGVARPDDIARIRGALVRALRSIGAEDPLAGSMAESIESAAKGSYTELYLLSPCDAKILAPMQNHYLRYIEGISPPPDIP